MIEQDAPVQQLRIDELAHASGVPSRTIRFYNTQGLLPPPVMRGRVAYYNQEHLLVLGIIRELKERYDLSLESIKQLLAIRAQQGDIQMNLALKQRYLPTLTAGGAQVRLTRAELVQQTGANEQRVTTLLDQGLLFPVKIDDDQYFSGDDVLLVELYEQLEQAGIPLALPALMRFQLRQLVRSEVASCEQYLLPRWQAEELTLEQQTAQFERLLALTDTLISLLHRKMLYQR